MLVCGYDMLGISVGVMMCSGLMSVYVVIGSVMSRFVRVKVIWECFIEVVVVWCVVGVFL